jgi:trimeric autotransporter adhesin
MTSPSIQFAPSINSANMLASSAHELETNLEGGTSFAAHLDQAVQSSARPVLRPETQSAEASRTDLQTTRKPATDATSRHQQAQATAARPATAQAKQRQSADGRGTTAVKANAKVQNADPSSVQKAKQSQPEDASNADSQSSSDSRNTGQQASEEQTPSNSKASFAQAVAQSAASEPEQPGAAQPGQTDAPVGDASIPAAVLALLQASQGSGQAVTVQPANAVSTQQSPATDSNATGPASATLSNPFRSLNFSASAAAYQAGLASFPTSDSPSASTAGPASASPSTSANSANSQPSPGAEASASSADTDASAAGQAGSADAASLSDPVSDPSASAGSSPSTSQANQPQASQSSSGDDPSRPAPGQFQPVSEVAAALTDPSTSSSQQNQAGSAHSTEAVSTTTPAQAAVSQSDTAANTVPSPGKSPSAPAADSATLIRNLRSGASQQDAARSALNQALTAAKSKTEPVAAVLQQAVVSTPPSANHQVSPVPSFQSGSTGSQASAMDQDSGSPAASATQVTASGSTEDSTGDSTGDDSSTTSSGASQESSSAKSAGSPADMLPSSAFNSDSVGGVAPAAVHAVASAALQSNTGFDDASSKAPAPVPQNLNSAAQEKAFAAWQSVSEQVGRVVNTATLNALQNGTEMRVQLRTDAFGSMDIRATLEGGKVGAAIGVESAEAHNALLGQLPALQQSLNERQVQLDQISVVSSHQQSVTDFGTGSGKQNGDPTTSGGYRQQTGEPGQAPETASSPVTEAWQPEVPRGRLSVRA